MDAKRVGVALPAQDIKRARDFYEQKLGFKPDHETPDGGVTYRVGGTTFNVFPSSGKASGTHTQMGVSVDDVEGTVKELKSRGVKAEDYDMPDFKTVDGILELPDGSKQAWIKDTEGNLFVIGTLGM